MMTKKQKLIFEFVFKFLYSQPIYKQKTQDYIQAKEFIQSLHWLLELTTKQNATLINLYKKYKDIEDEYNILGGILSERAFHDHILYDLHKPENLNKKTQDKNK